MKNEKLTLLLELHGEVGVGIDVAGGEAHGVGFLFVEGEVGSTCGGAQFAFGVLDGYVDYYDVPALLHHVRTDGDLCFCCHHGLFVFHFDVCGYATGL